MPVFDHGSITTLANQDPGTDASLPPAGLLSYKDIATSTALADTDGQECKIVTGKRDQKVTADMRERILGSLDSTITGNETHTVKGSKTETVTGLYTLTVIAGWNEEQLGPVNRHYVLVVTDTFDDDHQQHVPDSTSWQNTRYSNTFVKREQMSIVGAFQLQMALLSCLTVAPVLDLEYKTIHCELHLIHVADNIVEGHFKDVWLNIKALGCLMGAAVEAWASANSGLDYDSGFPLS